MDTMSLDELEDRLESLELAHAGHKEMQIAFSDSLERLSALRKQGAAYAAFGVQPLAVQLPVILQANIARCKAKTLWKEIEELAGLGAYNAALAKIASLTLLVHGSGKSRVLRIRSDSDAIGAGSWTDAKQAYRKALALCWRLRKGKRTLRYRSIIDSNAFVAWQTLRVGLMQVKQLLSLKAGELQAMRIADKQYAALQQWARVQRIELSSIANPSAKWVEAGRLNGRVYVIHNALGSVAISKGEKAATLAGYALPVVPECLEELKHGQPRKEVKITVKGKQGLQRTLTVNRL